MLSFEQPILQNLDELKEEVAKYKKVTLNKNLKELTETEQILFCQNRKKLCESYYKLSRLSFEREDYENAAVYLHEGARIYFIKNFNWPKSEKALEFYRGFASKGNAFAQYHLGFMYQDGKGVRQDFKEALKWYRLSAEKSYASAQNHIGFMYQQGQGVPQDFKEALKWFRLAAEQGNVTAQNNLGFMYYHGKGISQDIKEALKWYRLAAEQGHAAAQSNLGFMYYSGKGVFQDFNEAVKWSRLAAEQGHVFAQNNLGVMYEDGQGVPQDINEALKWYRLSAEQGNTSAQKHFIPNQNNPSPVKQYHCEMLSTQLQSHKICEHMLKYEEVWEAFEFDVRRAPYQSKLFENIESMKKYFLALSSSSLKLKSWQIEKLNALHVHFFKFYHDRLNEVSDEERVVLDNKKYESFNAINCGYINDAEDINMLITISSHDFLSFKGESEERAKIQKQLCEKYEKLILVANLKNLNVKWGGAATVLINGLLQTEDVVYARVVDLNIEQMAILNGLWNQRKLGQIITAEKINRRLNVKVVMEETSKLSPLSMFIDRELDITIDDESDKKRKLGITIENENEKNRKRQKKEIGSLIK